MLLWFLHFYGCDVRRRHETWKHMSHKAEGLVTSLQVLIKFYEAAAYDLVNITLHVMQLHPYLYICVL